MVTGSKTSYKSKKPFGESTMKKISLELIKVENKRGRFSHKLNSK